MKYSVLGRTGLKVSKVGFGGGGIAQEWGPTNDEASVNAVRRALEMGINFFDVCYCYGEGKASEILGVALEGHRDEAIIGTKVDLFRKDVKNVDAVVTSWVDASLGRLRTDVVDILYLHSHPEPHRFDNNGNITSISLTSDEVLGPVLEAFRKVQKAGKVRFIGIPNMRRHMPSVKRILKSAQFDVMLAHYNLLDWTSQEPLPPGVPLFNHGQTIPLAKSLDMGVVCIRSHAMGALTTQLDRLDNGGAMAENIAKASTLKFLLEEPIHTLSQAAMIFCLMNGDIDTSVPGVKNVSEIEELAGCIDLPYFPPQHLARLRKLYTLNFRE